MQTISFLLFRLQESGLGIYKRKKENEQESKHARVHAKKNSIKKTRTRTRKHALVQESVHAKKNSGEKTRTQTRVRVFLSKFFFAWTLSCTSACFLERVLFCVDACVFFLFSYFLCFFYKFPALA